MNRILAPSFLAKIKSKLPLGTPTKQPDSRVNQLNDELSKAKRDVDTSRSANSLNPVVGIECQFHGAILKDIAFAYDVPYTQDSIADIALGTSPIILPYWVATPPDGDVLSKFFDDPKSFIYNDTYCEMFLKRVFDDYVDKEEGAYKLQSSVYTILDPSNNLQKRFFMKAISGPDGSLSDDIDDGTKFNVTIFAEDDIKFTLTNQLAGKGRLEFTKGVKFKSDLLKLLDQKKACLVVENAMGVSTKMSGKNIRNCSVGLYKTSYLRRLRDAIKI